MRTVNRNIVKELRDDALEYVTNVKGKELTRIDINTAETLILFGYMKAMLEIKKNLNCLDEEKMSETEENRHKKDTKNIPELYLG